MCIYVSGTATLAQAASPIAGTTATASQLESVLSVSGDAGPDRQKIGYVREQTIKEMATALGARAGLADESKVLLNTLNSRAVELDKKFNFNPLVIHASVLPPVISQSRDVVVLEAMAMKIAGAVFSIDEPARFAMPTPTWRDWLYIGLDESPVAIPSMGVVGPNTPAEKKLWDKLTRDGYEQGRIQAQAVFAANLSQLQRVHDGMRLYFDLWRRGMVSAPIIATSSEILQREGPNTINVGNTLFRITAPTDFNGVKQWTPLE